MRKVLSFIAVSLMFVGGLLAQSPQKFTYQAVVRDAYNTLVPSKPIGVKISILQSSLNGPVVYAEEHTTVTNANGLMTLQIGGGNVVDGDFASIDWSAGPYFLKCETDPQGGTNYTVTGAQQLLSVPYALYSEKSADAFSGDYNDLSNAPTIPTTTGELANDAGFITAADIPDSVSYFVNDAGYITKDSIPNTVSTFINDANYITKDSIPTNVSAFTNDAGYLTSYTEVQALSISHDTIFLTNGGFVKLPAGFDGDYNSLTNTPTNVSHFTNDANYITKDSIPNTVSTFINDVNYITKDSIPTNVSAFANDAGYLTSYTEVQALSISNDTIFLTNGGFVKLPAGFDGDYNSLINKPTIPTNVSAFTNDAHYITKDSIPNTVSTFINDVNYITKDSIPTNVSAFTNDAGYLTSYTEVQALSISHDTIFLTNGGFVKLPAGFDGDYNSLTNTPTIPTNVSAFTNDAGYITKDSIPNTVSAFINDANYITKDSIPTNVSAFANDAGYLTSYTEVQALSISNDTIFLTNGGFVKLPAGFDGDYNSLTNKPTIPTNVSAFTNDVNYITKDSIPNTVSAFINDANYITKDSIPTNVSAFTNDAGYLTSYTEVQALSISNDTIFLTNGGFVKLPAGFDGDYNSLTNTPTNVSHFTNDANYITKDSIPNTVSTFINDVNYITKDSIPTNVSAFTNDAGYLTSYTEVQALSISNDTIFLTNGGFVKLPAGFNGDYNSLTNTPTIPTNVSAFTNDANYITKDSIPNTVSTFINDANYITKDSIPTNVSAFTNDAGYLTSFTEVQALSISNDTIFLTNGGFVKLPAGFDGDYNSLINKPTIPTNVSAFTNDAGYITKDSIQNTVITVVNNANYITKDSIPTNVSAFTNDAGYLTSFTEVQALSISNDTIFLTNGGFVKLPAGFDGDYNSLINKPTIPTNVSSFTNDAGYITKDSIQNTVITVVNNANYITKDSIPNTVSTFINDANYITKDSIPTNVSAFTNDAGYLTSYTEVQALSISNDTIFLTNGGFVKLPASFDGNYNSLTNTPTNVSHFINDANYITKDSIPNTVSTFINDANYITKDSIPTNVSAFTNDAGYLTSYTEVQALSISNDTIFLTNGGFVKLPAGFDGDYNSLINTPTNVSHFINDANYITKDSIPNTVITLINAAGYLTKDSICAATASCGYITSADLNLFLGQINDKIDSLKTIINAQAEKIDSLSGHVNSDYIPWNSIGLNPNDSQSCQGTPTVTDVDGNTYNTVQIGNQCWMRENLKTTKYADNTPIAQGSTTSPTVAYWYYPNNDSSNKATYGLLYNWKAVMNNSSSSSVNPSGVQGICPTGWHVPSDVEWTQLETYVSGLSQYVCGSTSTYIAKSLASTTGWASTGTYTCAVGNTPSSNNATGFFALPAGRYHWQSDSFSYFLPCGETAYFWSSTASSDSGSYYRFLYYNYAYVVRNYIHKMDAFSVRCLKD